MRFKLSGWGPDLTHPLTIHFDAASFEDACARAMDVLGELPECEGISVSGGEHSMEIRRPSDGEP